MRDLVVNGVFLLFAFLLALTFWFVYMNRASERVISGAVPIAIVAIVGVFLTIFVFANEPEISRAFPVTFFYRVDGTPVNPPFHRDHNDVFLVAGLLKEDPARANDGAQGRVLYHHLLQKALFEWIVIKHAGAWDSEHLSFDAGERLQLFGPVRGRAEPSMKVDRDALAKVLAGNWFSNVAMMSLGLTVPKGTVTTVQPPSSDTFTDGEIRFSNPICTLTITTTSSIWSVGIGPYRLFTSESTDELQALYRHATYIVRAVVSFTRYRIGDPRLPLIKRWATQIVDGLQDEFDEQIAWREARDNFILSQQAGPGGLAGRGQVQGYQPP